MVCVLPNSFVIHMSVKYDTLVPFMFGFLTGN